MKRSVLAVVAAFFSWWVVAQIGDVTLRLLWAAYAMVEREMTFSFGMQSARLLVGALASVAAGAVLALIKPASHHEPIWLGVILLLLFVPSHIYLWHKFPIWYHAIFLGSLLPLILLGTSLTSHRADRH